MPQNASVAESRSTSPAPGALNVSRQTVNAIETERYDPSLPLAFALPKLFRCKLEDMFEP